MVVLKFSKRRNLQAAFLTVWIFELSPSATAFMTR